MNKPAYNRKNLINQSFGRLKVVNPIGKNKYGRMIWLCKCICGNLHKCSTHDLLTGHTKSCGCFKKEITSNLRKKNLIGLRFDKLIVLKEIQKDYNISNRKIKRIYYLCRCDCGKMKEIYGQYLRNGETKTCGCGKYSGFKIWNTEHWRGGFKEKQKRSDAKRRLDYRYVMKKRISALIRDSLINHSPGKNGRKWEQLVGYNIDELIKRLKNTIPNNYKWENFINNKTDLQIDHIIPIVAFKFTIPNDLAFKQCWALSNLRLLPAKENLSKGAKLIYPFIPLLPLAVNQ